MKKKIFTAVLAAVIAMTAFTGCGKKKASEELVDKLKEVVADVKEEVKDSVNSSSSTQVNDNRKQAAVTVTEQDIEVNKGYLFEDNYGTTAILTVKNNASVPVGITGNGTAKDAQGQSIGAGDLYINVIGPGETAIGTFRFSDVHGVTDVDYSLEFDAENLYYEPVLSNLSMQQTLNPQSVTVTVTNNGKIPAMFVEACAIFIDASDNILDIESCYLIDGNNMIAPGGTVSNQIDCYSDTPYDHVDVYLTGYGDSTVEVKAAAVSDQDFAIREYKYENDWATQYYLAVTNNSKETVSISANGLVKDANGNSLGAGNMSIDILGPGETSVGEFYFSDVHGAEKLEYTMTYSTDTLYSPVISSLATDKNRNGDKEIVTVTNNGSVPAMFVSAYAIFLDASGNVVEVNKRFFVDNDNELKPGASLSQELNSYTSYDHAEIYLTGRAAKQ